MYTAYGFAWCEPPQIWETRRYCKGREPNSAAALASQPAAGHSLSFYYYYCFMTLGWGFLVGPAAESCSRIWLPRLSTKILSFSSSSYSHQSRMPCSFSETGWIWSGIEGRSNDESKLLDSSSLIIRNQMTITEVLRL